MADTSLFSGEMLGAIQQGFLRGVFPSVNKLQAPAFVDCRNVDFVQAGVRKQRGWASFLTEPGVDPVRTLLQHRLQNGNRELWWCAVPANGDVEVYEWDETTVNQRQDLSGGVQDQSATRWATMPDLVPWGDWVIYNDQVNTLRVWKTSSFAALGGTPPTTVHVIAKLYDHLLAFNTDVGPGVVEWCDADDPETWAPASDNAAGNHTIREIDGPIRAVQRLGDRLAIYSDEGLVLCAYIGAPFYFSFQPALNGIGAVSKRSVVSVGRQNYGLSRQGFFVTDGLQFDYIDDPAVKEYVQENVNWAQASKINGFNNEARNTVEWYVPTGTATEPDFGVTYNYRQGAWGFKDYGRTASTERQVLDDPVLATDGGQIFYHESGVNADGAKLESWVQTKPFDMGQTHGEKFVDVVKLLLSEFVGLGVQLEVGTQARIDDDIVWYGPYAVDDGVEPIDVRRTGRYISLKLSSTKVDDDYLWSGFDVLGRMDGLL